MTTGLSELPDFRRLTYFHGQMLAASDFQGEQKYFIEKLRLRNRCLHGYGVACGLSVSRIPPAESCGTDPDPRQPRVTLHPGVALDCLGNEIVIRCDCEVELLPLLSGRDQDRFHDGDSVYLCVEYWEQATRPTRGVYAGSCGGAAECEYGWRQDSYRVRVTLAPPDNDGCGNPMLRSQPGPVPAAGPHRRCARRPAGPGGHDSPRGPPAAQPLQVHHDHRDQLAARRLLHSPSKPREILGTYEEGGGLRMHFSKDVHTRCLTRGVVDVQVIEGGRERHAETYLLDGRIEDRTDEPFTRRLRWRQTSRESLQERDRVLITVRTPFILDRCCRPVDGTHVGGRVPLLPGCQRVHARA